MTLRPVQLLNIEAAVADVQKLKPGERRTLVNEYLRGIADPTTSSGKQLMYRRALFVTALREKKVWTG